jgi:hypothetical protein
MLIKIIDDLNNGAYSAGSQYKMKRGIGCDETEKYFFSIKQVSAPLHIWQEKQAVHANWWF